MRISNVSLYNGKMDEVVKLLTELEAKGWTQAAIADELGTAPDTLRRWKSGTQNIRHTKAIALQLEGLLKRRNIPKKRRYEPGSRQQNPPTA